MANRLTKRSRSTYVASVPAVAARPAYCVTTSGDAVKYIPVTTLNNAGIETAPGYSSIIKFHYDAQGKKVVDEILIPVLVHNAAITTCFPAVQAVAGAEAKVITDNQVGWNSGARSVDPVSGDFELSFTLAQVPSGAVLCGLASSAAQIGSFSAIEHGIYTSGGVIKFYESGVEKHVFSAQSSESPAIRVQRLNGVVTAIVGSEGFKSSAKSAGQKSVTAALYAGGDYVDEPTVVRLYSGSSYAPLSLGGEAPSSRQSSLMGGFATGRDNGTSTEPVIGLDGVEMVFEFAMASVGFGIANDQGVTGGNISVGLNSAEEFQASVRFVLDGPDASSADTDQFLQLNIVEGLIPDSSVDFQPMLFATINESLDLGTFIDLFVGIDAKLMETLALQSAASASMVFETIIRSGLLFSDFSSKSRNQALQYATNLLTGTVTRYDGFEFTSFCRVGSELWATRPDGLYKIGGSTDNGEFLSFLIDFAADDQGSPRTKRLENIFFGITTDGQTLARLTDDFGREQTYRLIQRDSSEARINTAKGASSRFWHLRLEGVGATYAELDNIEWVAATGARRTKR